MRLNLPSVGEGGLLVGDNGGLVDGLGAVEVHKACRLVVNLANRGLIDHLQTDVHSDDWLECADKAANSQSVISAHI